MKWLKVFQVMLLMKAFLKGFEAGSFSSYLSVQNSLYAEIIGAILAINISWTDGYKCVLVC